MAVKIVIRKKENKDGTYPLAIRITKDRKASFIHIGQNIKEKDWDSTLQRVRKSHPNSKRLNNYLIKKLAEANDKLLELETQKGGVTSLAVKRNIKPNGSSATFLGQAALYLENLKISGKYNRISAEQPRINRFKEFVKGDIAFQDITVPLLQQFQAYLKGSRQVSDRTVINHLVVIRSLFSQAMQADLVDRKYYPFGKGKIRIKFPDTNKIGLLPEEVKRIEELELEPTSYLNHARNVWLFAFYFAGMRVSDVLRLKWSDFQNDRLHYSMGKNAKAGSLKIPEKAVKILLQYEAQKASNHDLVFPDLKMLDNLDNLYNVQKKISNAVSRLNDSLREIAPLAGIKKKLTMHIARHTFGNISGERIPIQMLQKLYRHSSITTTIAYQANFVHKDADQALDAVVSF